MAWRPAFAPGVPLPLALARAAMVTTSSCPGFSYRDGELWAEAVRLGEIARDVGTPCYVYCRSLLEARWQGFDSAFGDHPHRVCYAVKANSNLAVLNVLAKLGSGFDVVSVGELERVLHAGGDPAKVVFSGAGKRVDELRRALEVGIDCFNVESEPELERLSEVARQLGKTAPVALRVNPDVDAGTHPYIATGLRESKFGVAIDAAFELYQQASRLPGIALRGVDCHIGSQLTDVEPFAEALQKVLALVDRMAVSGLSLSHVDIGGGLGIRYRDETPPTPRDYVERLLSTLGDRPYRLYVEPGRSVVGEAGVLLTTVEYLKAGADRRFAIVDAAMNDLMRPALYGAWQSIMEVVPRAEDEAQVYDVVGPVCETADFLGKDRRLRIRAGDVLAVGGAGAYGFVMSSNYNSRPRAAEVMVRGAGYTVVRQRESLDSLWAGERTVR